MGYMIHFNEDIVGADELKLIETKKAILEKLRVRYGFDYAANPKALAVAQTAAPQVMPISRTTLPR